MIWGAENQEITVTIMPSNSFAKRRRGEEENSPTFPQKAFVVPKHFGFVLQAEEKALAFTARFYCFII